MPANAQPVWVTACIEALEKVLRMRVLHAEYETSLSCLPHERVVASLPTLPPHAGTLALVLHENAIPSASARICSRFGMDGSFPPEIVFAETLNMIAGNLFSAKDASFPTVRMGVPSPTPSLDAAVPINAVSMVTDGGLRIKICLQGSDLERIL